MAEMLMMTPTIVPPEVIPPLRGVSMSPDISPIDLIVFNSGRGVTAWVDSKTYSEVLQIEYLLDFSLTDGEKTDLHSIEFFAFDDAHASNKANLLLMVGVEGTDTQFEITSIVRQDGTEVENLGTCTCGDSFDIFCPSHGEVTRRILPFNGGKVG
jgi:hypothetical protein